MTLQAWVGQMWPNTASKFEVVNPFNGEHLATVPDCGEVEANLAVENAFSAFQTWKKTTPKERAVFLHRIKDLLLQRQAELGALISSENGKPIKEGEGEVGFSASFFEWFAEEGRRAYGEHIPSPARGKELLTIREPAGVAAFITPWNFPLGMLARKVSAALAAGCTCVIKPAEDTPLTALAFLKLCDDAKLPSGVVSVLPCSRTNAELIGKVFCTHPRVSVVSFTGSTVVGQELYSQCGSTLKKLSLELGGNAPFVVLPTADLKLAVQGLMASKFRNAGQTCVTANRILVHRSLATEFVRLVAEAMDKELVLGNPADLRTSQGPLINQRQFSRVCDIVTDAVAKGAVSVRGGGPSQQHGSLYFQPTLLSNVTRDMRVFQDEIFGPVAAVMEFDTEEEAAELANEGDRGLAAYIYSNDVAQVWRLSRVLQVGMLGINDPLISTCEAPFGGVKHSGMGKEGSKHGLDSYTTVKFLSFGNIGQ